MRLADGSAILSGTTKDKGRKTRTKAYFAEIDDAGEVVWEVSVGDGVKSYQTGPMIELDDGNIASILEITTDDISVGGRIYEFIVIDRAGNNISQNEIVVGRYRSINGLVRLDNGDFAFLTARAKPVLIRFDSTGAFAGEHEVALDWLNGIASRLVANNDGTFLMTGQFFDENKDLNAYIVQLDNSLNVVRYKIFDGPGRQNLKDVAQLPDGTIMAVGSTSSQQGNPNDGYIVRLTRDGQP